MRFLRLTLLMLLPAATASCSHDHREPPATFSGTSQATARPPHADSVLGVDFLRILKAGVRPGTQDVAFTPDSTGYWDRDSVLAFVGPCGLAFHDANTDSTYFISRAELGAAIAGRAGPAFLALAHLSTIAAIPYPQYSSLAFGRAGDATVVMLGDQVYRISVVDGYVRLVDYVEHQEQE